MKDLIHCAKHSLLWNIRLFIITSPILLILLFLMKLFPEMPSPFRMFFNFYLIIIYFGFFFPWSYNLYRKYNSPKKYLFRKVFTNIPFFKKKVAFNFSGFKQLYYNSLFDFSHLDLYEAKRRICFST